jgi:hypothetical protein
LNISQGGREILQLTMAGRDVNMPDVRDLEGGSIFGSTSPSSLAKESDHDAPSLPVDAFGDESNSDVRYKTLTWW